MPDSGMPVTHVVGRIIVLLVLAGLLGWLIWTGLPARFGEWVLIETLGLIRRIWSLD
ncbi:hypothetical protein [Actinoplanes couchii]|uniref:Uncharacterized protein n=1 Tax=Actinoplanes couchii TaxID=403638 RepID=A0ABQ3X083_9ACTN|nr:hypothetical protein [Actinoplanes couchii]MDR6316183.1 hypothetical protein [Actinoplanes couchii]GID51798.1 hypothetical protein Aco03nite_002020 [Actinoplanes couchii]